MATHVAVSLAVSAAVLAVLWGSNLVPVVAKIGHRAFRRHARGRVRILDWFGMIVVFAVLLVGVNFAFEVGNDGSASIWLRSLGWLEAFLAYLYLAYKAATIRRSMRTTL